MKVEDWLFAVDARYRLGDIPEEKKTWWASNFLKGEALAWWKDICKENPEAHDANWEEFKTQITYRFQDVLHNH